MLLRLGGIEVLLQTDSRLIDSSWQQIFGNRPTPTEPESDGNCQPGDERVVLKLQPAQSLSLPPEDDLVYKDPQGTVDVYRDSTGAFHLHFQQGALVRLAPEQAGTARGSVTADIFHHGRLEDVTFTSLAPMLRRKRRYLLHAAAVATPDGALLLVGPSHSGKTTSALALLLAGWKHLASDVVVLAPSGPGILAHPTAAELTVRPNSFQLLPTLRELLSQPQEAQSIQSKERLSLGPEKWSEPMLVTAICFPTVTEVSQSTLEPLDAPLALARLMEESVDRWDTSTLGGHIDFLAALGSQARAYRLRLGHDMGHLPHLFQDAVMPP